MLDITASTDTTVILRPNGSASITFQVRNTTSYTQYFSLFARCGPLGEATTSGYVNNCYTNPNTPYIQPGATATATVTFNTGAAGVLDSVRLIGYTSGGLQPQDTAYIRFRVAETYIPVLTPAKRTIDALPGQTRAERLWLVNGGNSPTNYIVSVTCTPPLTDCWISPIETGDYAQPVVTFKTGATGAPPATIRVIARSKRTSSWAANADTAEFTVREATTSNVTGISPSSRQVDVTPGDTTAWIALNGSATMRFFVRNTSEETQRTYYVSTDCGTLGGQGCASAERAFEIPPGGSTGVDVPLGGVPEQRSGIVRVIARIWDVATASWYADTGAVTVWIGAHPLPPGPVRVTPKDSALLRGANTSTQLGFVVENRTVGPQAYQLATMCIHLSCTTTSSVNVQAGQKAAVLVNVNTSMAQGSDSVRLVASIVDPYSGVTRADTGKVVVWINQMPLPIPPLVLTPARTVRNHGLWEEVSTIVSVENRTDQLLIPSATLSCGRFATTAEYPCQVSGAALASGIPARSSAPLFVSFGTDGTAAPDSARLRVSVRDAITGTTYVDSARYVAWIGPRPLPPGSFEIVLERDSTYLGNGAAEDSVAFVVSNRSDQSLSIDFPATCGVFGYYRCGAYAPGMPLAPGASALGYVLFGPRAEGSTATRDTVRVMARVWDSGTSRYVLDTAKLVVRVGAVGLPVGAIEVTPKSAYKLRFTSGGFDATAPFTVRNTTPDALVVQMKGWCEGVSVGCSLDWGLIVNGGEGKRVSVTMPSIIQGSTGRVRLAAWVLDPATGQVRTDTGTVDVVVGNVFEGALAPKGGRRSVIPGVTRTDTFTVTNFGVAGVTANFAGGCGVFGARGCALTPVQATVPAGGTVPVTLQYMPSAVNGDTASIRLVMNAASGTPFTDTAVVAITARDSLAPSLDLTLAPAAGSTITEPAFTINAVACDPDGMLVGPPTVQLNGLVLQPRFEAAKTPGCASAGSATHAVNAVPGSNTVVATLGDRYHTVSQTASLIFDEAIGAGPDVSAAASTVKRQPGAGSAEAFVVSNRGSFAASYRLRAECGASVASGCTTQPSVTLLPGRTTEVRVSVVASPTVGASSLVRLIAEYTGATGRIVADTGVTTLVVANTASPLVTITPAWGTQFGLPTFDARVDWCDPDNAITGRTVTLGQQPLPDTFVAELRPGCAAAGASRWTNLALRLWDQELVAVATDASGNRTEARSLVTYFPGPSAFAPSVMPKLLAVTVPRGAPAAVQKFQVTNRGQFQATYTLKPDCGTFANCEVTPTSVTLAPGASDSATVRFQTPAWLGTASRVALRARFETVYGGVEDTGVVEASTPTLAQLQQPQVSAVGSTNVLWPGYVNYPVFWVKNKGSERATYAMHWFIRGGFTFLYPRDSLLTLAANDSVVLGQNVVAPSTAGQYGVLGLTATARQDGLEISATDSMQLITSIPSNKLALSPRTASLVLPYSIQPHELWIKVTNTGNVVQDVASSITCTGFVANCFIERSVTGVNPGESRWIGATYQLVPGQRIGSIVVASYDERNNPTAVDTSVTSVTLQVANTSMPIVSPTDVQVPAMVGGSGERGFTVENGGNTSTAYRYTVTCDPVATCDLNAAEAMAGTTAVLAPTEKASLPPIRYRAGALGSERRIILEATSAADTFFKATGTIRIVASQAGAIGVDLSSLNSGSAIARDQCLTIAAGDNAAYECGDLRLAHALPTTYTMSRANTPTLQYNSRHANPGILVRADISIADGIAFDTVVVQLSRPTGQTVTRRLPWDSRWAGAGPRRVAIYASASEFQINGTGIYPYRLLVRGIRGTQTIAESQVEDTSIVVDRRNSYFGRGWWLAGLEQLYPGIDSAGALLWVGGDGSARRYRKVSPWQWVVQPAVDRGDTITLYVANGNYLRRRAGGGVVEFDPTGQQVLVANRLGYATWFYRTGPVLTSIVLPPGVNEATQRYYTFHYLYQNGEPYSLSQVNAPAVDTQPRLVVVGSRPGGRDVDFIRDPSGDSVVFKYVGGAIAGRRNRRNDSTFYAFDEIGLLRGATIELRDSTTRAQTGVITHSYCPAEGAGLTCGSGVQSPGDAVTTYDGPRTDVVDVTRFHIGRFGQPDTITNAEGGVTRIVRDATYPVLAKSLRTPGGLQTDAFYNQVGLPDSVVVRAPLGSEGCGVTGCDARTSYTWDAQLRKPTKIVGPTGETTENGYDPSSGNRLWTVVGGVRTAFSYSSLGQLASDTAADGGVERFFYDLYGNLDSLQARNGAVTKVMRDIVGREVRTESPLGNGKTLVTTSGYDRAGNRTEVRTEAPQMNFSCADCSGKPVPAQAMVVRTGFDKEGNVIRVDRDPDSLDGGPGAASSLFSYDAAHRKLKEQHFGSVESWQYDAAGNPILWQNRRGKVITSTFDVMNRVSERQTPGDTIQERTCSRPELDWCVGGATFTSFVVPADVAEFDYDSDGRMTLATNGDAAIGRTYYPGGLLKTDTVRLRRYDRLAWGADYVLGYSYDLSGRRTRLDHPANLFSGGTTRYDYFEPSGRLQAITGSFGIGGEYQFGFGYDSVGRPARINMPGGIVSSMAWDRSGQLARRQVGLMFDDTLEYDITGKISRVEMRQGQGIWETWYSGLGAVTGSRWMKANGPVQVDEYRMDAHGNVTWTWKKDALSYDTTLSDFDAKGRLWHMTRNLPQMARAGFEAYRTYDQDGNTILSTDDNWKNGVASRSSTRFAYGADNKLRQMEQFQSNPTDHRAQEIRYDALGRRVMVLNTCQVDCTSGIERYIWDGDDLLYELRALSTGSLETTMGNGPQAGAVAYINGPDIDQPLGLLRRDPATGDRFLVPHANFRGNYVYATDATGDPCCAGLELPGERMRTFMEGSRTHGDWLGSLVQSQQDVSGLMYRRNRYYDPATGRFTQQDPIGLAGGLNLYGFGGGDPVNYSDPFGLCPPERPWCDSPLAGAMRLFGASESTIDKWVSPAYGGARVAGAPGNGLIVRGMGAGMAAGARGARQSVAGSDRQFGKKFGEHRDANTPGYRTHQEYRELADDIYNDPSSTRTVIPSTAPKHRGEIQYRRGDDLLRLDPEGNFRSLYRDP